VAALVQVVSVSATLARWAMFEKDDQQPPNCWEHAQWKALPTSRRNKECVRGYS
jgi:hypothetical protein